MQNNKEAILKEYFGYGKFRPGQEDVIDSILSKRDVLCIMPTGAGKSICYQIPALMFDGVTIVVSPLISLMKDQVQFLKNSGIDAAYINSSLSPQVLEKVFLRVGNSQYKIIYVAPERLGTASFLRAIKNLKISLVVVDEAHCISRWGFDFRPSYLEIVKFIDGLPVRPVLGAFTATATSVVKDDICRILSLRNPYVKTTSFDRENLFFDVRQPKHKDRELLNILRDKKSESGIIYCATRKKTEEVYELLIENGFSATKYHAGLEDEEKVKNQDDFICDKKRIMVATNAFGMGIDKGNVSFVIHYNMPKDMESYYQEAGRAGRDGERAECILLYGEGDIFTNKFLIDQSEQDRIVTDNKYGLLNRMVDYCKTDKCLRRFILEYFGEQRFGNCGNCGNCNEDNFEEIDATDAAKTVLNCVKHLPRRYGKGTLITVLQGGKDKRVTEAGLDSVAEYGALKSSKRDEIAKIIDKMLTAGLLEQEGEDYPVIKASKNTDEENLKFFMRVRKKADKPKKKKEEKISDELFERLRKLRYEISTREDVPAYIIFSNATLRDMCVKMPEPIEDFLNVTGVGQMKCRNYGKEFIAEIQRYSKDIKG
ncbi:MAG: DNA helicase RecQ [Clostridia bacterium]|nr:DNA helicase RecQ [Clostridia bacterium]